MLCTVTLINLLQKILNKNGIECYDSITQNLFMKFSSKNDFSSNLQVKYGGKKLVVGRLSSLSLSSSSSRFFSAGPLALLCSKKTQCFGQIEISVQWGGRGLKVWLGKKLLPRWYPTWKIYELNKKNKNFKDGQF